MAVSTLQNFYKVKLTKECGAGAENIYVTTKPTPTNGWLVISPKNESLREIIRYTGTGTDGDGDFVTVANVSDRGLGGTTAQAHAVVEPIRMNYTAQHQQEIDDTIEAIVNDGAPLASKTVVGRVKLSVAPVDADEPEAVGSNDTDLVKTAEQNNFLLGISGMIIPYAGSSAPAGFLLCDGTAISRTTFATLFAIVGTTYGAGDGSTTFNLPNLQGRVPAGRDASQTEFDTLGETGGAKTHTLTTAQIPAHNHNANLSAGGSSSNTVLVSESNRVVSSNSTVIQNTGGGESHNNLQPYLVLNYIIKT